MNIFEIGLALCILFLLGFVVMAGPLESMLVPSGLLLIGAFCWAALLLPRKEG